MKKIPEENLRLIQEFTLFDDLYMNVFFKDFEEGAQWMLRLIFRRSANRDRIGARAGSRVEFDVENIAVRHCGDG